MYDTLYVFCTTCKYIFVYSILCFLCTLVCSTISAFKKIYTSKFASKLKNVVTIWLHDAFLCILLNRLWFHWNLHTRKHAKRHFIHVSILCSYKDMTNKKYVLYNMVSAP